VYPKFSAHDVAGVDANAEEDALVLRHVRVSTDHAVLDCNRASHGIDDTGEINMLMVGLINNDLGSLEANLWLQRTQGRACTPLHRQRRSTPDSTLYAGPSPSWATAHTVPAPKRELIPS
jgi:hypothetical protein